jgi:hypothetical protein
MKPAIIDLYLYQGSTFRKNFQWLTNDVPTDLTNCSIKMQLRTSHGGSVIQEFDNSNGLVITNATLGQFQLTIAPSISTLLNYSEYIYDIEISFDTDDIVRVIKGKVYLDKEVTK